MASAAVEQILQRANNVKAKAGYWTAQCPVHDDKRNSLSIREGEDGKALVKCFVGCDTATIVKALRLRLKDLFPKEGGVPSITPNSFVHSNGLTLQQYSEAKKLPIKFLLDCGLSDLFYQKQPVVRIPYRDEIGNETSVRFRLELEKNAKEDNRFKWRSGSKAILYGLWRLNQAREARSITLVEGESDCHTLWFHEFAAIGLPGASIWREDWARHFEGFERIYVVIEPDGGGEAVKRWLTKSTIRNRVHLVEIKTAKDPSALYLSNPGDFSRAWREACLNSIPWVDLQLQADKAEAATLKKTASELLHCPDLLDRIKKVIKSRGYAGDPTPPTLVYIAATSRLLEKPLNLALIAPSAAGKNYAVRSAIELIPPEAVYIEGAGSARALVYSEESFEHRVVVVEEADSIPDDGPAASAIRSIAEDNEMRYDVVERSAETGSHHVRHIVKPGPTSLITTSTRSLAHQLGTRMLEVTIPDDVQQTRQILKAHARTVNGATVQTNDITPFVALQQWLELAGSRRVIVPFAEVLADLVPAKAVRMRRDFRQLLTFIQAVALLHQCQREKNEDGSIIATLNDYAMTRELLESTFDSLATEGMTAPLKETVEAIKPGEVLSESELARRLDTAKTTIHYRVKKALSAGWLVNNEERKGHAAKLALGSPLPEIVSAIPTVEQVRSVLERSSAIGMTLESLPYPDELDDAEWKVLITNGQINAL